MQELKMRGGLEHIKTRYMLLAERIAKESFDARQSFNQYSDHDLLAMILVVLYDLKIEQDVNSARLQEMHELLAWIKTDKIMSKK